MRVPRRRPLCGAKEGTGQNWPYAARDTRTRVSARVFAVGRGAGFVVVAEVTARAAGELRLADGGPVWATVEALGWPATGPERHRAGVVARPAAWYRRSCPECDESCQRQRGRQGAAVEPHHSSTQRPTHLPRQYVHTAKRSTQAPGSPHPVQRENGAIRRGVRPPARPGA